MFYSGASDTAGYILTGGQSRRMGRNKVQLPFRGTTLVEFIAAEVCAAAGRVALVGSPGVGEIRWLPDSYPGFGPVGGIVTALADTDAEWNLIVAADMPRIDRAHLVQLIAEARRGGRDVLVPVSADGRMHPLCAVYRKTALPGLRRAVESNIHTVREALSLVDTMRFAVEDVTWLTNVNTPEDWASISSGQQ
jgi:molybdopterin-guanine dinucleotide biosynthesis protein A